MSDRLTAQIILFPGKLTNERIADSIMRHGSYKHLFYDVLASVEDQILIDRLDRIYHEQLLQTGATQNEPQTL